MRRIHDWLGKLLASLPGERPVRWYVQCRHCHSRLCIRVTSDSDHETPVQCPRCGETVYTISTSQNVIALSEEKRHRPDRTGCIAPRVESCLDAIKRRCNDRKLCCWGRLLDWIGHVLGRPPLSDYAKTDWYVACGAFASVVVLMAFWVGWRHSSIAGYGKRGIAVALVILGFARLGDIITTLARHHLFEIPAARQDVYIPRSLMLAFVNFADAILIFALFYSVITVLSPDSFPGRGNAGLRDVWGALWFSVATMLTADSGIKYAHWARLCAGTQLFVALFFLAVILATLAGYLSSGVDGAPCIDRTASGGVEQAEDSRG